MIAVSWVLWLTGAFCWVVVVGAGFWLTAERAHRRTWCPICICRRAWRWARARTARRPDLSDDTIGKHIREWSRQ